MEEVGSHDGEEEQIGAAPADAVITDALQDAARTDVPDSKCDIVVDQLVEIILGMWRNPNPHPNPTVFQKSEIRWILKIRCQRIQNFGFGPTQMLFS